MTTWEKGKQISGEMSLPNLDPTILLPQDRQLSDQAATTTGK